MNETQHNIAVWSQKLNRLYRLRHLEKHLGLGLERSRPRPRLEAKIEDLGLVSVSKEQVSFTITYLPVVFFRCIWGSMCHILWPVTWVHFPMTRDPWPSPRPWHMSRSRQLTNHDEFTTFALISSLQWCAIWNSGYGSFSEYFHSIQ